MFPKVFSKQMIHNIVNEPSMVKNASTILEPNNDLFQNEVVE